METITQQEKALKFQKRLLRMAQSELRYFEKALKEALERNYAQNYWINFVNIIAKKRQEIETRKIRINAIQREG